MNQTNQDQKSKQTKTIAVDAAKCNCQEAIDHYPAQAISWKEE